MGRIKVFALFVVGVLVLPSSGWAQGCVLCYTSAANGGPGAMRAFQMGILSLLAPALLLCMGVALLVYRRARIASGAALPSFASLLLDAVHSIKSRFLPTSRVDHRVRDAVQLSDTHLGI